MKPLLYENKTNPVPCLVQRLLRLPKLHLQLHSGLHLRDFLLVRDARLRLPSTGGACEGLNQR